MLNKTKTDPELGYEVNKYLADMGVQTPMKENDYDIQEKQVNINEHFSAIMSILGLDLEDDSLAETPKRVANMFVNEIFWGMDSDNFPKATTVQNKFDYDEMVIEKDINVQSNCEHHFVVIAGLANIGYIPNKKVLGLSKLNRIVEYFSKRPQIQERLTEQIYYALKYILETEDVAVVINAKHFCVSSRGVEDVNSKTITSKMGGRFKTDQMARAEFINFTS